jgi:radical SAM-linked protein
MRALLRALRRSGLPVALSQGFNPHLKIAFASALALGLESEAEFVDVELTEPERLVAIASRLSETLPPGYELREVRGAPARGRALAAYDAVSRYVAIRLPVSAEMGDEAPGAAGARQRPQDRDSVTGTLQGRVEDLLGRAELTVQRQPGKHVDIRPLIYGLRATGPGGAETETEGTGQQLAIELELLSGPSGTARVDEVLRLLDLDPAGWSVLKTDFWPLLDGAKTSPWGA